MVVLRKAATPYISPSGKKTIRWVCKCEACGREVTMLRNTLIYATSCGCKRSESAKKKERNQKVCVVCGNKFDSPPSERKKTCSPECSSVLRAKIQTGTKHAWSDEAKRRYSQNTAHIQQAKEQVVEATKKQQVCQKGKEEHKTANAKFGYSKILSAIYIALLVCDLGHVLTMSCLNLALQTLRLRQIELYLAYMLLLAVFFIVRHPGKRTRHQHIRAGQ